MFYSWKNPEQLKVHKTRNGFQRWKNTYVSWAANQHIQVISKGSNGIEDWINFFNI